MMLDKAAGISQMVNFDESVWREKNKKILIQSKYLIQWEQDATPSSVEMVQYNQPVIG